MRHKAGQKQEIRKNMVDAAARAFRRSGYAGVGVDGLAGEAGVTSGAIYSQFGSKQGAFLAALESGLDVFVEGVPAFQRQHGAKWLSAFADYYLGAEHRADLAGGCTIASLVPDVVRTESGAVREMFEGKATKIAELIAEGLAGPPETRMGRAWATLATFVGGLNLARSMPRRTAEDVSEAIKRAALATAGKTSAGAGA